MTTFRPKTPDPTRPTMQLDSVCLQRAAGDLDHGRDESQETLFESDNVTMPYTGPYKDMTDVVAVGFNYFSVRF